MTNLLMEWKSQLTSDVKLRFVHEDGVRTLRAIVSPSYPIVDDIDLIQTMLDLEEYRDANIVWHKHGDSHTELMIGVGTPKNLKDPIPCAKISNGELGTGAINCSAGVYFLICTNGMIASDMSSQMRRIHRGHTDTILGKIEGMFSSSTARSAVFAHKYMAQRENVVDDIIDWGEENGWIDGSFCTEKAKGEIEGTLTSPLIASPDNSVASLADGLTLWAQNESGEKREKIEKHAWSMIMAQ